MPFATRSLPLSAQIMSAAFSAIMMVGAFVHADVMVSMIDGSNTRRPPSARTRSRESNTALSSSPILHVPTGRGSSIRFRRPLNEIIVALVLQAGSELHGMT